MSTRKSALKTIRKDKAQNLRNRSEKSRLLTGEKTFHAKVAEKDVPAAETALKALFSNLDKAGKRNVIKMEKVARKKSRLTTALNKVKA